MDQSSAGMPGTKRHSIALSLLSFTVFASPQALAQGVDDDDHVAPASGARDPRTSGFRADAFVGYAVDVSTDPLVNDDIDAWGVGVGVRAGYTLAPFGIFLGGTYVRQLGDEVGDNATAYIDYVGFEFGREFHFGRDFTLRPFVIVGGGWRNVSISDSNASASVSTDADLIWGPGITGRFFVSENAFLGFDARWMSLEISNEGYYGTDITLSGIGAFGTFGVAL